MSLPLSARLTSPFGGFCHAHPYLQSGPYQKVFNIIQKWPGAGGGGKELTCSKKNLPGVFS